MIVDIVEYSEEYRNGFEELLKGISKELFGYGTGCVDTFIGSHWVVYLALHEGRPVGFASFIYNNYCGMRPPTVGADYLYVLPTYRDTKVSYLLSIQIGHVSVTKDLPLEHYYASDASKGIGRKLIGKKMYEAYIYEPKEVARVYGRLISKVKIKE